MVRLYIGMSTELFCLLHALLNKTVFRLQVFLLQILMYRTLRENKKLLSLVDYCGLLVMCMGCQHHTLPGPGMESICKLLITCGKCHKPCSFFYFPLLMVSSSSRSLSGPLCCSMTPGDLRSPQHR